MNLAEEIFDFSKMIKIFSLSLEYFLASFLLFINLSSAYFEFCDHNVYLNQSMYIASPNYPDNYRSGSSCKYHIIAPVDHTININCNINFNSNNCSTEFFVINTEGDRKLRDYEYVCRTGSLQRKSLFNKMTIAYISSSENYSGSFSCFVSYEKQPCDCGWSMDPKIVGGSNTGLTEYPFMAGLMNAYGSVFCGGSVINHHIVLTAAHCLDAFDPQTVIVGAHNIQAPSKYTVHHAVRSIRKHEGYIAATNDNDIAIVETNTIMEWSRGVAPICLPLYYFNENFVGAQTDIAGWGTTLFGGPRSDILLKATVAVIPNSECGNDNINNMKMCTFAESHDSCQFDSGGPVILRSHRLHLLGIISYGKDCGGNSPAVNTRITSYLDWIMKYSREHFCVQH